MPQTTSAALGEIRVECWSVDVGDEVPFGRPEFSAVDSVSEREKVDATHHVGLVHITFPFILSLLILNFRVGNVRRAKSRLSHEAARRILLASFIFRYRPIGKKTSISLLSTRLITLPEVLQAKGFAPMLPLENDALQGTLSAQTDVHPLDPLLDDSKDAATEESPYFDVTLSPDVKFEEDSEDASPDDPILVPQKRSASPISLNADDSDPILLSDDEGDDEERIAVLEVLGL